MSFNIFLDYILAKKIPIVDFGDVIYYFASFTILDKIQAHFASTATLCWSLENLHGLGLHEKAPTDCRKLLRQMKNTLF